VLPGVDGRDELVEHVLWEVQAVSPGREAKLLSGEDHGPSVPCLLAR
jgi:hypothetical protein